MKLSHGNIWDFLTKGYYITIPTNIGWTISTSYKAYNPMGRGLAKDAKSKFPGCDIWLASEYMKLAKVGLPMGHPSWIMVYSAAPIIFFPTKPLDPVSPHQSWSKKSDRKMISALLDHFATFVTERNLGKVAVPLLGAGNGGLDPADMKALIQEKLGKDNRFLLITPVEL